jgi:D-sedoheptulose 7-phosphate isomerase
MTSAEEIVKAHLLETIELKHHMLAEAVPALIAAAESLRRVLEQNGTIYLCGNGGSAADAQHVAAELVGRFQREREPCAAVSLATNSSILTAISNDYGFDQVFSRQVRASVTPADAVVGISTSGRSSNVLQAITVAREIGAYTLAFTGEGGGPLAQIADARFLAPSENAARIQECHIVAWHIICDLIERSLTAVGP